ncbi:MAG: hypothetical protein GQ574_14375 [Crocinitomix sp.]|nr:hypothetical protein [Crocinitomix sp.]
MNINRRNVALSMVIPFSLVFIIVLIMLIAAEPKWDSILNGFFTFLFGTSVFWGSSVIVCLIVEWRMLRATIDKKKLKKVFIIETIVAAALSLVLFPGILVLGMIGNTLRYQWLIHKERTYNLALILSQDKKEDRMKNLDVEYTLKS